MDGTAYDRNSINQRQRGSYVQSHTGPADRSVGAAVVITITPHPHPPGAHAMKPCGLRPAASAMPGRTGPAARAVPVAAVVMTRLPPRVASPTRTARWKRNGLALVGTGRMEEQGAATRLLIQQTRVLEPRHERILALDAPIRKLTNLWNTTGPRQRAATRPLSLALAPHAPSLS